MRITLLRIIIFSLAFSMVACKTTRRKKDVSKLAKFYHNTTAKYNGYFNANVLVEEALDQLEYSYADNFNQLIPVYKWHGAPNVEQQFSKLDTAIKKVSVVASLHTPSKWTDDCYLMAGKAHYVKRDYEAAEVTLQYLVDEFDPTNPSSRFWEYRQDEIKKKERKDKEEEKAERKRLREEKEKQRKRERAQRIKDRKRGRSRDKDKSKDRNLTLREKRELEKEKEEARQKAQDNVAKAEAAAAKDGKEDSGQQEETNPLYEPSFDADEYTKMGHVPAFKEGQLYLARTFIERDKFSVALNLLRKLIYDEKLSRELKEMTNATMAELLIAQREYNAAVPFLETALNTGNSRSQNARYAFVIAQISQLGGNASKASNYFAEAQKLSTDYEMEFSAKLAIIQNDYKSNAVSREQALKRLNAELEESKNFEYRDRIFYAMAQIAKEGGDLDLARTYLAEALKANTGNNSIALEAYFSMASYYYEQDDFISAKLYYDSTMQFMPKTDPRYLASKRLHESLIKIDEQMAILNENDSALIIAEMSPEERQALVRQKIEAKRKAQEIAEEEAARNSTPNPGNNRASLDGKESNFFAYDPQKVSRGNQDFRFQWGDRPLIDDWRRQSTLRLEGPEEEEDQPLAANTKDRGVDDQAVEKILGAFPKTKLEKAAVRQKVVKALYDLSVVYREQINRPDLAIEVLEELIERFPRSAYDEESLYALVLASRELGDDSKETQYANLLTERYPNSEFAKIINDPNYIQELQEKAQKVESYYQNTYAEFEKGNYARTISMSQRAVQLYSTEEAYMPKFKLLVAMSKGQTEGKDAYAAELRSLIKTYERSEEATRAREIIRFLNGEGNAFAAGEGQMGDFLLEEDKLHYVIAVLYNSREVDMNRAKIKALDFTKKYFKLQDLAISNIYLDLNSGVPLIIVRNFDDKKQAMRFYQTAKSYKEDFLPEGANYDLFAVSQRNYRVILKQRTVESYRLFFEQYYLRSE